MGQHNFQNNFKPSFASRPALQAIGPFKKKKKKKEKKKKLNWNHTYNYTKYK